jgi:hypothetical protein
MPVNLQFKYNGKDIEIVKDFNYLGIYFSRSGSFKQKKHQAEKAIKVMYEVLKKGRKHNFFNCTHFNISLLPNPHTSQPYNKIGFTSLSKRSS